MGLTETIKDGDWRSVRSAIAKLGSTKLGPTAKPTFAGLTLTNAAVIGSDSVVFQPGTDSTTFFQVLDADGGTPILNVDSTNERVGIGTNAPDSIFHIKANVAGTVGSHPAGQLIIQDPDDTVFGNAVITGYESDGAGNPDQQLWYLGSSSSSNSNIIFLNRRNSKLQLGTNDVSQLTILGSGNVGIGITSPKTKLTIEGALTLKEQAAADGDTAAYGQVWCKDDVPNTLWFVNDLGTEIRIAPQDLHTEASPTFAGLSLGTGELTCGSINRASGTLTVEVGGVAQISITNANVTCSGTFESTGVATLADASLLKTSAAPTTDAMLVNKKYVDDNAGGGLSSACKIYASSNQDIVSATWTKVTFDSTEFDIDSEFDNANDRITIKTAGYYIVTAVAGFAEAIQADKRGILQITRNASGIIFSQVYVAATANPSLIGVVTVYLNVNDYIEMLIYHDHGSNRELYGDVLYTNLIVIKIDD